MTRRRGFTLMEVLLAAGMLTVVVVALQEVFGSTRRLAVTTERGLDFDRASLMVLRRLERALASASPYLQPEEEADFHGDKEDVRFLGYRVQGRDGAAPRMAALHLGQDADGVYLETLPPAFSALGTSDTRDQARSVERMPELKSFEASYFDGRDWKPDWALRRTLRLPRALRLALKLARPVPNPGGEAPAIKEEATSLMVLFRAERDVGIR